jgi:hypothetical protein
MERDMAKNVPDPVLFTLKNVIRKHGGTAATIASVSMLVTAGNLPSPSLWLVLPAWLVLGLVAYIHFDSVPNDSPYKQSFYLMGIPLLFFLAAWRTPFLDFFQFLFEPSGGHLFQLVSSRPFLVLVIIYFGSACVFYSSKVRERDDSIERYKQQYKEGMDIMKSECERLQKIANDRNA